MSQIDWLASLGALINARLPKGSAPDSYDRLGNLIGTDKTDRPWIVEQSMNHTLSVRTCSYYVQQLYSHNTVSYTHLA